MKTQQYNPSQLEVEFAKVIKDLAPEIEARLGKYKITDVVHKINLDNPLVSIKLKDMDSDEHELVLKIIQRPDHI